MPVADSTNATGGEAMNGDLPRHLLVDTTDLYPGKVVLVLNDPPNPVQVVAVMSPDAWDLFFRSVVKFEAERQCKTNGDARL